MRLTVMACTLERLTLISHLSPFVCAGVKKPKVYAKKSLKGVSARPAPCPRLGAPLRTASFQAHSVCCKFAAPILPNEVCEGRGCECWRAPLYDVVHCGMTLREISPRSASTRYTRAAASSVANSRLD